MKLYLARHAEKEREGENPNLTKKGIILIGIQLNLLKFKQPKLMKKIISAEYSRINYFNFPFSLSC